MTDSQSFFTETGDEQSGLAAATQTFVSQSPSAFRQLLCLDRQADQFCCEVLQPWQQRDLEALDATWSRLAEPAPSQPEAQNPSYCRAYIERPRGHSKTTDMAVQLAWILQYAKRPVSGLAAAADQDQARLILSALERLVRANPALLGDLAFSRHEARNVATGSLLTVISSDVSSSYGALADFIVCDELCHWREAGLWNSLLSTAAKKPGCVLTILTNAGVGCGWQWEIREHARTSPNWYFSSLAGPQAPWITEAWLEEQRLLLRGPVFRRLWLNEWQHSDGEFVTLAEVESCRDESLSYQSHGQPRLSYVAAIDYAEKHDLTVGCVCHREGRTIIVDRMDVVRPSPLRLTPVDWVEGWLREVGQNFPGVRFIVDPHQLVSVIQKWQGRYSIQRFEFRGGAGNQDLALALRQNILQRTIRWYPGCGAVASDQTAAPDTLETELASLLLTQTSNGRVRIDHIRDGKHHDDRSFALGVCCLELAEREEVIFATTPPAADGGFASWSVM
jgi:hypothetical protein